MSDKGKGSVLIFLVISLFLISISGLTIGKNGPTVSIDDYSFFSGETITIPINISNAIDLATAEIYLNYDPSTVHVTAVSDGDFDLTLFEINNQSGWTRIGGNQLMSGWLNGKIILANVSFKAIGKPGTSSFLEFTKVLLQNKTGSILPTLTDNGTCRIKDTIPPVITNVTGYPEEQEKGGYTNITCQITDNVAIDEVWVNMTYPDTSYHNFSMIKNSYYFNQTYDIIGSYVYFIWVKDTSGNTNKSSEKMFSITLPSYTLSISVLPQQGGTVTSNPPGDNFEEGTQVTLTAVPATGYQFSQWEGDVTGTSATITITMDTNKNINANFSEIAKHTPIAYFTYLIDGSLVTFSDASTDSNGIITTWYWEFGDNQYSVAPNPAHEYEKGGHYTVKLTVTDNDGETDSFSIEIAVEKDDDGGIPGFEIYLLLIGFLAVLMAIDKRKTKNS